MYRSWRLAAAARVGLSRWRAIPVAASGLRESSSGPKHESTVVEPNGFLFNEKVIGSFLSVLRVCLCEGSTCL